MSKAHNKQGWTDDLSVQLPDNRSVKEVAEFVIQQALSGTPDDENESLLMTSFGVDDEDASLIRDRVFGGIMRAAMGGKSNQPHPQKDPFASASFELARQDSSIIANIYPQFAQLGKRPWWKFWE